MPHTDDGDRRTRSEPGTGGADLWPGELLFTAWGRYDYGHLDLRVFDQSVWWVNIQQRPHRLTEMTDEYMINVIAHLEANVDYLCDATM